MNVSGVGATPPQPPLPPVAPTAVATSSTPSGGRPSGEGHRDETGRPAHRPSTPDPAERQAERPEPPPLRMLTVTEMRVMLGQLPVSAGRKLERYHSDPTPTA